MTGKQTIKKILALAAEQKDCRDCTHSYKDGRCRCNGDLGGMQIETNIRSKGKRTYNWIDVCVRYNPKKGHYLEQSRRIISERNPK